MNTKSHWESVYGAKAPEAVSWYAAHLRLSLQHVKKAAPAKEAHIIDVGGGESTLVDDLLADGYSNITVLGPGTSIYIPVGTAFQYRNVSNVELKFICISMPPWPGESEATYVKGIWQPTI